MGKAETWYALWRAYQDASGVRTAGMSSKDFMGTRESHWVQAELVGSDKSQSEEDLMTQWQSDWLIVL